MGLFNFKRNAVTGKPVTFHRSIDENLVLTIAADDGSGTYTLTAYEPLASEIEMKLFEYRQNGETINLTLEYARDGQTVTKYTFKRMA